MTLRGGPANKLGNRYEKLWTVAECIRLLRGDTDAIRIEDPTVDKAEFVVTIGVLREFHQVKRSHPNGKWSLAALASDGLLQAIGNMLTGNDDHFVFVSGSDAPELAELCKAAKDAESVEEFNRNFLAAREREQAFKKLLDRYWNCDGPTAFGRLRRIEVRVIGEPELEERLRLGAQVLFLRHLGSVLSELRAIIEDSVHCTVTRQYLIEKLGQRGYRMRPLTNPERAGVAVQEATSRYLEIARRRLIRKTLVQRAAAETLLSRLEGKEAGSVVTGKAGSGKTACVVEVTEALRERCQPVLTFRLDRVPFQSVSTTADLGHHLDLEESPVLVLAAAAEAAGRPGVLIVDQLDAVSTMSGRSSGMFDIVEGLLQEARGMRTRAVLHTVVVCRAFDWQHDHRLRQLIPSRLDSQAEATKVEVTEFTLDEIKPILNDAGFDPVSFGERQLQLLRLPQNLSLFLEADLDASQAPTFRTAMQLFERYWTEKRRAVAERIPSSPDQWMEVIKALCEEMTSTQQLSVPRETLDGFVPAYVEQLASEGVLTFDGRRYGFGHESFFDYCFARVFIGRREPLASFLKGSEQHLFRRAQVRQVLAYLRDADCARYVEELRSLLSDDDTRVHIKDLGFALLAEVADPTDDEWAIWQQWITPALKAIEEGTLNRDKLSEIAWNRFLGSWPWFEATDQRGVICEWLASGNGRLTDMAVNYLGHHQSHSPDRAAALIQPYADHGQEWTLRLRSIMNWANLHTSRRFFDLFLYLVDNGTLDETQGPNTFWSGIHALGQNRPEWIPEVTAHRLRRRLSVIRAAGTDPRSQEFIGYDQSATEMFNESAKRAPAAFVKHVLPVVLEVSDFALLSDTPPKRDAVWEWLSLTKAEHTRSTEACLLALAGALSTVACESSTDLCEVISELRSRDTHVANYLLLALYTGGAAHYADEAVALLCDEPWRFQCGSLDSPLWCAMEAIRAVVPRCTAENRKRLEAVILGYMHPRERTRDGYKESGQSRFALLSAVPSELRSVRANAHYQELKRKFGEPDGKPRGFISGWTRSPIEKDAADKITDDQWLRAIAKYHSEDSRHFSQDGFTGGAWQLSQQLKARAEEEPERFARLSLQFSPDANPVYLERTLSALVNASVASDLKLQVCRKAFAESLGPCGSSIADVLGKIEDRLPDDAVQMLHQLATEHKDPDCETTQEWDYGGDILGSGINTTRGRAAGAIRDLIFADATYIERFHPTLRQMIKDRSAAVLSCVAGTLCAVSHHYPALSMSLFREMNLSEDLLLDTHYVRRFIHARLRDNFAELRPIIERMFRSSATEVCKIGARFASLAVLMQKPDADHLVDKALQGDPHHRLGVAEVAADNIAVPECRAWCEARLAALFDDDDPEVRREAASCFRQLQEESLDNYVNLIAIFRDSRAFEENSFSILDALDKSPGRLPGMICEICAKFLDCLANEAPDNRTGHASGLPARTVAKLIFRTYQQHQTDEWTSRSLDLIDRLCLERIYDAWREFEQFER